ncbi:uncharacterized protein PpBr36_09811 [Pyricularia pennisetigena]|uniref:uncharacterized protein n=1 Tax=Pyricularia pennisetigena TaxID=1578925 RepID=UPI00114FA3A8|nr:uncharacterized protein PpBr36_09811 [Pyricularia pennisetigena]TLS22219.1 hypothetical protein PpBr36_09811 [Pyricularia pennisetigena]
MLFSQGHRPDRGPQGSRLFANTSVEEHATSPVLTPGSDASDTLRPTYTTAGTLYNPGTAASIQAPIRRRRNNRWQPSHVSELAGLPKSILANLPLNMNRTRSPATTASSLKHYAPLQQNYDRAMTPPAKEDVYFESGDMDTATLSVHSSIPHDHDRLSQARLFAIHTADTSRAVSQSSNKEESEDSDCMVDAAADALAARLNFKSLTSLASYENPSQQIAKRALARGRSSFKYPDLLLHGTANTALQSQSFRQQERPQSTGLSQSCSSATRADRQYAGSTSNPKALWPVNESVLNQNLSQLSLSRGPKALVSAIDTAYPSALSTGPGAPLPLTAGPPGLRQYRPSSFEANAPAASTVSKPPSRIHETENGLRKRNKSPLLTLREAHEQDLNSGPYIDDSSLQDQLDSEPPITDRLEPANSDSGLPDLLARTSLTSSLVYETESPDKINQYYPDQLPPDYTPSKKSDLQTSDWEAECVARRRVPGRRTAEQLARHQKRVDESWYAGISRIHQTMDDAIAQMQTRQLLHTIGRPEHADAFSMSGSTSSHLRGRELSLQDVISTDRSRHAAPLLNMAFATLLSYVDECGPNKQRSPFMDYREWRDLKTAERHRAWSMENSEW